MNTATRKFNIIPFFNSYTLLTLIGIMAAFNYLLIRASEDKQGIWKLYLLMLIQLTPFLISFSRQHYDYISFVMFNHFFTYSIAKLNQIMVITKVNQISPEGIAAIEEFSICSALIIATYYLSRRLLFYRVSERENYQLLSLNRLQFLVVATYVICVPMFLDKIPSWLITLHFATMAADMVLLLCSTCPGNERLAFYLRFLVALSTAWYFLSTGFLTMVGNLAGYIFIASCLQRKYKQLIFPIMLAVLASLLQNVKEEYRREIRTGNMAVTERLELIGGLMYRTYVEDIIGDDNQAIDPDNDERNLAETALFGFARVGDDSLERVISLTPKVIPYWQGESYSSLPFIFIPRAIWNDKPTRHIWNQFGRTYGFLGADDYTTSVGVGYLAEAYMNFGYTGMYWIAIFMGLFTALVERVSYHFLKGYYYFTFMCFLMPVLTHASDLTTVINSVFTVGAVLLLFRTQFLKMARRDEYS